MSRPPVSPSERVVYTGFDLGQAIHRRRQRTKSGRGTGPLNDHVRNQNGLASASFEL